MAGDTLTLLDSAVFWLAGASGLPAWLVGGAVVAAGAAGFAFAVHAGVGWLAAKATLPPMRPHRPSAPSQGGAVGADAPPCLPNPESRAREAGL